MVFEVVEGEVQRAATPALVVSLFEGVTSPMGPTSTIDQALNGGISTLIADGEIKGKLGELTVIHTFGRIPAGRIVVAGLGKDADFTTDRVRRVAADTVRMLKKLGIKRYATVVYGAGLGGLDGEAAIQAMVEGTLLGDYSFTRRKTIGEQPRLEAVQFIERDSSRLAGFEAALQRGRLYAEAQIWARNVSNEPSNIMTPTQLAEEARQVAEASGLQIEVLDRHQARAMGMNAFLAVAQGSAQPPKLIVLRYSGDPDSTAPPIGLVGKGITFDTGGISIKPAANMDYMKGDMGGAAAVIGAMGAIGKLKPKINVIAITPATENMPSGSAYKPGDVITAMNGKTIEIINTDAEGRVVLSDALTYASQLGCSPIIDIATLTGAIGIALGDVCSGVMGTDQAVIDDVMFAGQQAGERFWQLPLYEEYEEAIKGGTGDWLNSGGREAGSITAAMFLKQFVGDGIPWAHLDIAGTDWASKDKGVVSKGCTGFGARALINFVVNRAAV